MLFMTHVLKTRIFILAINEIVFKSNLKNGIIKDLISLCLVAIQLY